MSEASARHISTEMQLRQAMLGQKQERAFFPTWLGLGVRWAKFRAAPALQLWCQFFQAALVHINYSTVRICKGTNTISHGILMLKVCPTIPCANLPVNVNKSSFPKTDTGILPQKQPPAFNPTQVHTVPHCHRPLQHRYFTKTTSDLTDIPLRQKELHGS